MGSLLIIIAVSIAAVVWVRGTRRNRQAWLEKLNLPGVWRADGATGRLEMSGELSKGNYRLVDTEIDEHGRWHLDGHDLVLHSSQGPKKYDLRLFDRGKIGLHGPGLTRRIYLKGVDNVVPLRRRN
ncbi:MAG: hypothetical protein O3A63_15325 [Proteobacteria bacterium]|nr:hypothetical protein [Pseudomonadota bacterium]